MSLFNRNPRNRSAERAHHATYDASLESQLCRLHIRVLCTGQIPTKYQQVLDKYRQHRGDETRLKLAERDDLELIQAYLEQFGMPATKKDGKPLKWITLFQMRILSAFCDFIDDPRRCHQGKLLKLHQCKSALKTLQGKQRVAIVKVVTALFCAMCVDGFRIGRYAAGHETPVLDGQGHQLLQGIPHYELRGLYNQVWKESISRTKYTDVIKMLKLAGYLEVEACYLAEPDAAVRRAELRAQGATEDEVAEIPSVRSQPAYKWFTPAFIELFGIHHQDSMIASLARSRAARAVKKLSNLFATYSPFSDGFWTRKRKALLQRLHLPRYPQGAPPAHDSEASTLPEFAYWH